MPTGHITMSEKSEKSIPLPDANYWRDKLAAFLHDTPSKCLDIPIHQDKSASAMKRAGFDSDEVGIYDHGADHVAAAADRIPFPKSRISGTACAFDGYKNAFRHPLSGDQTLVFTPIQSSELGEEWEQSTQPKFNLHPEKWTDAEIKRAQFFSHWRLWREWAIEKDFRMGFLPADTRIPDHTIWNHTAIVSALAGCRGKPAFLKFQIGPVQDFIAAARNTRDLWSGSYLLSWLMATGLKRFSELSGPDAVVFPSLRNQPLFDLQWRDDLWSQIQVDKKVHPFWEEMSHETADLLTPNLPNVFLALVSADKAPEIARAVEKAIREEWERIARSVFKACVDRRIMDLSPLETASDIESRYHDQIDRHIEISWLVYPWPDSIEDAVKQANQLPDRDCVERLNTVLEAFEKAMPMDHRDERYYGDDKDKSKTKLNNVGLAWSVMAALCGWELDSVRQTRAFRSWAEGGWADKSSVNAKDALTGKEEMILGGSGFVDSIAKLNIPDRWKNLFKHNDEVGAITLIKRCWHLAYLVPEWGFKEDDFPYPSTEDIACHKPKQDSCDENQDKRSESSSKGKYFAVIAFDGDEIGKWVSGAKTPSFRSQLAQYEGGGALEYFERESNPDNDQEKGTLKARFSPLLESQRMVSPSYHLQFSEALANFSRLARPVVEAHSGRLIYAGGDDVLAMLPADSAILCAQDLRRVFGGQAPSNVRIPISIYKNGDSECPGFLCDGTKDHGKNIPMVLPGPCASASVGVAIAHFKSPLQDVVRAAQLAEKRAKRNPLGRNAIAVTLMKRSGEIQEWGCKWDSNGVELLSALVEAMKGPGQDQPGPLSNKFPQRVCELLEPYLSVDSNQEASISFDAYSVILREMDHALDRQCTLSNSSARRELKERVLTLAKRYLESIRNKGTDPNHMLQGMIGLCKTSAFTKRIQF